LSALRHLVGAGEVRDVVLGVVEADVLERVGYGTDEVVLLDGGHGRDDPLANVSFYQRALKLEATTTRNGWVFRKSDNGLAK
jgi:hypothetical protein